MMNDRLRRRILAEVAAIPSPTRAQRSRGVTLAFAGAAAMALALFVVAGGARPIGRPAELVLATVALAALVALPAALLAWRRAPSPRGRSRHTLLAVLVLVPLALVAGKLAISVAWPGMTVPWPERPGLRCMGLMLSLGMAPLAAALWTWHHRAVRRPALTGAALGVAAGACAWVLVDLWCPVAHPQHLALGHVLPLALLGVAGMVAKLVDSPSPTH